MPQPVGRVSKLFGQQGELLVSLYDAFPAGFTIEEPLFVVIDGLAVPLFLERFERRGRSGALVVFADLDNEARAGELVGKEFSVRKEASDARDHAPGRMSGGDRADKKPAPEAGGEFLLEDFIGFTARLGGGVTGAVEDVIDGENPLFQLDVDGREVLVPAADELIASFDPARREIVFDLPEGLLDLYLNE